VLGASMCGGCLDKEQCPSKDCTAASSLLG